MDRKWVLLFSVCLGNFMVGLDSSAVNTILPVMNRAFGSEVATVQWVITAYLAVLSASLLTFGRLGDLRGHKPVCVSGFAVFVLASACSALAPTPTALIVSRASQAVGAAMVLSNSSAILTMNFPANQRGRAMGAQSMMVYLGLTTGPSFGGWVAHQVGWQSVFFINVPIGLLALFATWRLVPPAPPRNPAERFDLLGGGLYLVGLATLLLGLNRGQSWGWSSAPTVVSLVVAIVLGVLFVVVERRVQSPMLDLTMFRSRVFSAATLSAVLSYMGVASILFLIPFYLTQGRGMDSDQSGLILSTLPVLMAITAPVSGTLSDRIGSRLLATLGMSVLAFGLVLLSQLGPQSQVANIMFALAVSGLGIGLFTSPNNSALMGSAPRHRQGVAGAVLATSRYTGQASGVGLVGAVFMTVMAQSQASGQADPIFGAVSTALLVAAGASALGAFASSLREGSPQPAAVAR